MSSRSQIRIGKIGEHLCAAALLRMGLNADIVNQDGFDILVYIGDRLIKVQVKSTLEPRVINSERDGIYYSFLCTRNSKKKTLTKKDTDIICFVAIDLKLCYFMPIEDLKGMSKRLKPDFFDQPDIEDKSWDECYKRYSKPKAVRDRPNRGKSKRDSILSSADVDPD